MNRTLASKKAVAYHAHFAYTGAPSISISSSLPVPLCPSQLTAAQYYRSWDSSHSPLPNIIQSTSGTPPPTPTSPPFISLKPEYGNWGTKMIAGPAGEPKDRKGGACFSSLSPRSLSGGGQWPYALWAYNRGILLYIQERLAAAASNNSSSYNSRSSRGSRGNLATGNRSLPLSNPHISQGQSYLSAGRVRTKTLPLFPRPIRRVSDKCVVSNQDSAFSSFRIA